jgi:thymidylate synthase
MINEPLAIVHDGFQQAWLDVVQRLIASQWELRNLVVQIKNPGLYDDGLNDRIDEFARTSGLLAPRHVAYTIFPEGLYRDGADAAQVFTSYNRANGLYDRLHKRKKDWGTYFRRMTHYEGKKGTAVNQLENIINAFRDRKNISKAAYTLVIQYPGGETVRPLGGPCLNYLAVQAEPDPFSVGLMAVYRNHDFLERAYGNYWGLCNLVSFIAKEVGATPGPLTCVSSHAYVDGNKTALRTFVEGI